MKVTILQGIPGSGKTSLIPKNDGKSRIVVSADNYFIQPDGSYLFDASKLAEAHNACLREYVAVVSNPAGHPDELVVDNTNTTIEEVARYYALALAYGHQARLVALHCDPVVGAQRNVHGVSLDVCRLLSYRIESFHAAKLNPDVGEQHLYAPRWWSCVLVLEGEAFDWATSGWA